MTKIYLRLSLVSALAAFLTACGGDGSTTSTIPVTAITIFNAHSVAFKNNTAMAWGYNGSGQLGNGVTTTSNTPVSVLENGSPLTGLKGISAGSAHTLAFFNNSTVHAWGANFSGELGNNSTSNGVLSPVGVLFKVNPSDTTTQSLSKIAAVAAGGNHSLALDNQGKVWSWGANYAGQLGNNSNIQSATAVKVLDPVTGAQFGGVSAIAAGGSHSLALASGQVFAWGYNNFGQLGNDSTTSSTMPVRVILAGGAPLDNVKLIAAGGAFSVAVRNDDTVWAWGYNGFGQLGLDPVATPFSGVPQQITGITGSIEAVSAGLGHILVLAQNPDLSWTVWGWGFNGFGQLGGVTANIKPEDFTKTPTAIAGLTGTFDPAVLTVNGMSPILAIGHHSLARNSSGLWAWGNNNYGQLGVAPVTPSYRAEPATIAGF